MCLGVARATPLSFSYWHSFLVLIPSFPVSWGMFFLVFSPGNILPGPYSQFFEKKLNNFSNFGTAQNHI